MKKALILFLTIVITQISFSQITLDSTEIEERVVVENLEIPWDMTYSSDGWIWFTELSGKISRYNPDNEELQIIYTVNDVAVFGFSAGMHSIVLHPDFEQMPHVFLHYTYTETSSKIVRFTFDTVNNTLIEPTNILTDIPGGPSHNGSRMLIDNDKLFIALGDSYTNPETAQDLSVHSGKFLRMNLDGSVPDDNPISGSRIWSWGHRNPQGFCMGNGLFYSSEHGTFADDEINIIQENRNFGWPEVEGLCDLVTEMDFCNDENVAEPIWTWTPSIAPCGLEFYDNAAIPEWQNSLLLAVLKDKQLIQLKLDDTGTEIKEENIFLNDTYGRLRDVLTIPDGRIFVCTTNRDFAGTPNSEDDKIIELKAVNEPVSIKQALDIDDVVLYPNPANDKINLKCNSNIVGELVITDLTGKTILRETIKNSNNHTFDLKNIESGMFYLKLNTNNKSYPLRFIICR